MAGKFTEPQHSTTGSPVFLRPRRVLLYLLLCLVVFGGGMIIIAPPERRQPVHPPAAAPLASPNDVQVREFLALLTREQSMVILKKPGFRIPAEAEPPETR